MAASNDYGESSMTLTPTLEGGLVIEPGSEKDWQVLQMISRDSGRSAYLAESLAGLMIEDSEWEEYVVPDLTSSFDRQSSYVAVTIEEARKHGEQVIFVKPKHAEQWYGAVNQARLALEARYKLSKLDDLEGAPDEMRSAYFRDRFYLMLQSMLLEYVMGETSHY